MQDFLTRLDKQISSMSKNNDEVYCDAQKIVICLNLAYPYA